MNQSAKFISTEMLLRIFLYEPDTRLDASGVSEKMAIDFLKISYLFDMSYLSEIIRLPKKNVKDESILLERSVWNETRKEVIEIPHSLELRRLLDQYKQKGNTKYVFSVLNLTVDEKRRLTKIKGKGKSTYNHIVNSLDAQKTKNFTNGVTHRLQNIMNHLYPGVKFNWQLLWTALRHHRVSTLLDPLVYPPSTGRHFWGETFL